MSTAVAHPNIALVKYWGKRDLARNLPAVPSLSLTLDTFRTTTSVIVSDTDSVEIDGVSRTDQQATRVLRFLDTLHPDRPRCTVVSANTFPAGAGLASSASGFAALTVAAADALGLSLSTTELSAKSRVGSGSACRSLFGGFSVWRRGVLEDGSDSHAEPLTEDWDVRMVVAVVSRAKKPVGSTAGMLRSRETSPFYEQWVETAQADLDEGILAVQARDLQRLGEVMESSTFKMHATMHTAVPPLLYWHPATVACLHAVFALRAKGVGAWATMDAGPQVKVLCTPADAETVADALRPHAVACHILGPGPGASLL